MERQRRRRIDEALAPIRRYGFRRVRDRLFETRQHWGDSVGTIVQPVAKRRQRAAESLDLGCDRIPSPVRLRLREAATRLDHLDERLKAVSPLAILERGYAVVAAADGAVVRDAAAVSVGDEIGVRLARGALLATVERSLPVPETEIAE
jgi:exodeoxyribonuclease VII large subunit